MSSNRAPPCEISASPALAVWLAGATPAPLAPPALRPSRLRHQSRPHEAPRRRTHRIAMSPLQDPVVPVELYEITDRGRKLLALLVRSRETAQIGAHAGADAGQVHERADVRRRVLVEVRERDRVAGLGEGSQLRAGGRGVAGLARASLDDGSGPFGPDSRAPARNRGLPEVTGRAQDFQPLPAS